MHMCALMWKVIMTRNNIFLLFAPRELVLRNNSWKKFCISVTSSFHLVAELTQAEVGKPPALHSWSDSSFSKRVGWLTSEGPGNFQFCYFVREKRARWAEMLMVFVSVRPEYHRGSRPSFWHVVPVELPYTGVLNAK